MISVLPAILSAMVATAPPPAFYWSPIPIEQSSYRKFVLDDSDLFLLDQSGAIDRWDGEAWVEHAPPPPGDSPPSVLKVAPDGSLWVSSRERAYVRRFDGAWGKREILPNGYVVDMAFGRQGEMWAVGYHGYVARRSGGAWERLDDLPLDQTTASNVMHVVVDRGDNIWLSNPEGLLLRLGADGVAERLPVEGEARLRVTLDRDGRPVRIGDGLIRLDGDGETIFEESVRGAVESVDGWWIVSDGEAFLVADGTATPVPVPTSVDLLGFQCSPDGTRIVAADAAYDMFELRRGYAPWFRDAASEWGLSSAGDRGGARIADMDGDGLEDLLAVSDSGVLRILRQGSEGFEDVTEAWGLETEKISNHYGLCDLDGNGLDDLLVRDELVPENKEQVRVRYLRNLGGHFQEVDWMLGDAVPTPARHAGHVTCADVDGDGDPDVLFAGGRQSLPPGPRVAMLENLGHGRLRWVDLAQRGLGSPGGWVSQVLVEDLDRDGSPDFAALNAWGDGFTLLRGLGTGQLENVTAGSGLDSLYGAFDDGWFAHLDGDEHVDLLAVDIHENLRAWRGRPGLVFEDATDAWDLASSPTYAGTYRVDAALADVDGDGWPDVFVGTQEHPLRLLLGSAGGAFRDVSDGLPLVDTRKLIQLIDLDLAGDGDRDLLVLGVGDDVVFENLTPQRGGVVSRSDGWRTHPVTRRLAWVRPAPDGLLLMLLALAAVVAFVAVRLHDARIALGRAWVPAILGLAAMAAYLAAMESALGLRLALVLLFLPAMGAGARVEVAVDRRRKAQTVGRFRLLRLLGEGGMGEVHHARDENGDDFALKLVHPRLLQDPAQREEYIGEAENCSRIDDPRVIAVHEYGQCTVIRGEERVPTAYLAMELLSGSTVEDHLKDQGGRLDVGGACTICREVALALAAAHEALVVHRDVKPGNVMLLSTGGIKLMDFGAARWIGHDTRTVADMVGTLPYMAPEQLVAIAPDDESAHPRHLSDIYALGVMLYQLLTGRLPIDPDPPFNFIERLLGELPRPPSGSDPEIPVELDALVLSALAKNPGDRPADAQSFAEGLRPWAADMPVAEAPANREGGGGVRTAPETVANTAVLLPVLQAFARWAWRSPTGSLADFVMELVEKAAREETRGDHPIRHVDQARKMASRGVTVPGPATVRELAVPDEAGEDGP